MREKTSKRSKSAKIKAFEKGIAKKKIKQVDRSIFENMIAKIFQHK